MGSDGLAGAGRRGWVCALRPALLIYVHTYIHSLAAYSAPQNDIQKLTHAAQYSLYTHRQYNHSATTRPRAKWRWKQWKQWKAVTSINKKSSELGTTRHLAHLDHTIDNYHTHTQWDNFLTSPYAFFLSPWFSTVYGRECLLYLLANLIHVSNWLQMTICCLIISLCQLDSCVKLATNGCMCHLCHLLCHLYASSLGWLCLKKHRITFVNTGLAFLRLFKMSTKCKRGIYW